MVVFSSLDSLAEVYVVVKRGREGLRFRFMFRVHGMSKAGFYAWGRGGRV